MQFKIIAIPAVGDNEQEDALNKFLRSHRVVSVHRQLIDCAGSARWCFCVEYLLGAPPTDANRGRARVDYKQVLSEDDFSVFAQLREVRKQVAANDAIPVYAVCTNDQLAEMAKHRPRTAAGMKCIDGFGDAKAAKYAEAFIGVIQKCAGSETHEESGSAD